MIKIISIQDNVRTNTESVQCHHVFDTAFTRWCDVIDCVTNRFAIGQFLLEVHCNWSSICCRFKIFASKYIWPTILTFWGHLMLSVMWDMGPRHFGVTTLTFLGHVTSSVTWPLDSPYPISYSCPIVTKPLSLALFEILGPKVPCAHTHTLTETRRKVILYSAPCNVLHWTDN